MRKNYTLWFSAAYALFLELFVVIILWWLNVTTTQFIVLGILIYAILFFIMLVIMGLMQVAKGYYD